MSKDRKTGKEKKLESKETMAGQQLHPNKDLSQPPLVRRRSTSHKTEISSHSPLLFLSYLGEDDMNMARVCES